MIRTEQDIIVRSAGEYDAMGRWQEGGTETPGKIMASVQPARKGDYQELESRLEGRRFSAAVRIYTDARLNVAGENKHNGDILLWEGERYVIVAISPWRTTVLRHYRYTAIKEIEP